MTRLTSSTGELFATGEASLHSNVAQIGDRLARVRLQVEIAGSTALAVVNTGGAYLVVDPQIAREAGLGTALHRERVVIRGFSYRGEVYRVPVRIVAEAGVSLHFEATAFVPELDDGEHWPLPSYLGWQGCLERIRLALDPGRERAYFGALG
jgi:hypothetical protein